MTRRATLKAATLLCLAGLGLPGAALADFRSCLAGIGQEAAAAGVSPAAFQAATAGITFDDKVIELSQAQPEFKTPIWDYMSGLVDEERVSEGRSKLSQHASALATAAATLSLATARKPYTRADPR